jgi:hypothetical protein
MKDTKKSMNKSVNSKPTFSKTILIDGFSVLMVVEEVS